MNPIEIEEIEIGKMMQKRFRIYLDINFWIKLREIYLFRDQDPKRVEIFQKLMRLCEQERCICPASEAIFIEAEKQQDPVTLKAFSKCIGIFSRGIVVKDYFTRFKVEFECFFKNIRDKKEIFQLPAFEKIWTRVGFVMGQFYITSENVAQDILDDFTLSVFRKATFEEMVKHNGYKKNLIEENRKRNEKLAERLTKRPQRQEDKNKCLRTLFAEEISGLAPEVARNVAYLLPEVNGFQTSDEDIRIAQEMIGRLIYNGFNLKPEKFLSALPNIYIDGMLHAEMRRDPLRKYKPNDFMDFKHISAGLPYCHVIATDSSMRSMIDRLHIAEPYGTSAISDFNALGKILYEKF